MKTGKKCGLLSLITLLMLSVSLTVSGIAAGAAAESYLTVAPTARFSNTLAAEPTVIFEVDAQEDLDLLASADKMPAVVMLTVDADMKVSLGQAQAEFKAVFDTYIKGKAIPALRVGLAAVADAFIAYMTNTYYIADITVVSPDINVLSKIYADKVCYVANSVYDITGKTLSADRYDLWQTIGEANAAGCNILMINGADPNASVAASYAAALSKVCWGYVAGDTAADAAAAIAAGCYGVAGKSHAGLTGGLALFDKNGFTRAQFLAAHRGITTYANENSATALAAAANEGATHVEVDLQITADGKLILCHDSDASPASTAPGGTWVALKTLREMRGYKLDTFSDEYGDTFATLDEVIETLIDTDVIFILELKLDNGSELAVDTLKAIDTLKATLSKYEKMQGRWFAITFFAPYARQMRELMPEIPVGYLGYGASGNEEMWENRPEEDNLTKIDAFIPFLRQHNVLLDVTKSPASKETLQAYLARGYVQNTWTFQDTSHFADGFNIATTDKAEACAFMIKELGVSPVTATAEQIVAGKVKAACRSYNGWITEEECDMILLSEDVAADGTVKAILYRAPDEATPYGIYSPVVTVTIAAA